MNCPLHHYLFFLLLFLFHNRPTIASKKSYVVYLGSHSHGPQASLADLTQATESHYNFLESYLGSRGDAEDAIFYSYTRHINGFAANLEEEVAAQLARHPSVISVFPNQAKKLHTTRSWEFLGLEHNGVTPSKSIWEKARYGEGTIIGNLDTGVWSKSKSFNDEGLGPIPSKWKGICQNDKDPNFHCNRKLIGARYFNKGYGSAVGPLNASFDTPRDIYGHGSHTLSTAGGSFVAGASVFGFGKGTAKGGSPRARVAAYKICWTPVEGRECYDADIMMAFDAAIHDGVDVLSISIGIPPLQLLNDSIAIGSFHAVKHGIVVVLSAGNYGPSDGMVSNVWPWQISVGASSIDRDFTNYVITAGGARFKGGSLSSTSLPAGKFYKIISAADARAQNVSAGDALLCKSGTLDPTKVKGKIVVCLSEELTRVQKGVEALQAGAVGMVLANNLSAGYEIIFDPHILPAAHINYPDGVALFRYINSTKSPMAQITRITTQLGVKPAPYMAAFSSKGPSSITPEILKPDITAPGISIIAAYTGAKGPTDEDIDKRRVEFNSMTGTSMSCPHVAGVAGLLKTLYPKWTPAAIRSAIMTTATTMDNAREPILNASLYKATPFSYGAGHISPNSAMDPGLVYDASVTDYLNFLCSLGFNQTQISLISGSAYNCPKAISLLDLNYPSITVPNLSGSVTVSRKVKNVGTPGTYVVQVIKPKGISVSVNPKTLKFGMIGEEKSFRVKLTAVHGTVNSDYTFGALIWSDNKHQVRSPIVVKVVS